MLIANLSYALMSNIVSTIISILVALIVPELVGVRAYGYWQLYIFYTSYLGFFNAGWTEGVYLRYGGRDYRRLDRNLFTSQFWLFTLYITLTGLILLLFSMLFVADSNKQFVFRMVAVCLVVSVPRGFLLYILEATNRIKDYAKITLADRVIYCVIIVLLLLLGIPDYKLLVLSDLVAKSVTLFAVVYTCRDILFSKFAPLKTNLLETILNVTTGIKLLFANIASMLVIGVVRFGIEHAWDVKTFGKVSLTLSLSNLMMILINAFGTIMFPALRRTDKENLPILYVTMRDLLMLILIGGLVLYFPLKNILVVWLPQYVQAIGYMAFLFPICIFEAKMALLINTYLKALRRESIMLKVNLASFIFSVITTIITVWLLRNLNSAVLSIVILLATRCILAEVAISRILKLSLLKDVILELVMTLVFIFVSFLSTSWLAMMVYVLAYIMYLIIKFKDINTTVHNLNILIKSR